MNNKVKKEIIWKSAFDKKEEEKEFKEQIKRMNEETTKEQPQVSEHSEKFKQEILIKHLKNTNRGQRAAFEQLLTNWIEDLKHSETNTTKKVREEMQEQLDNLKILKHMLKEDLTEI